MRKYIFIALLTLIEGNSCPANSSKLKMADFTDNTEVKAIAQSENKFTKDLYLALSKSSDGNLFFSPFSITTALAMVHIGSQGNTESQMKSVMHLSSDKASIRKAFHDLMTDFKNECAEYELRTSNMAYISNKLSVLDEFSSALSKDFLSTSELVNFDDSEPVRNKINSAVEKETKSKIKDLIPSGVLDSLTRMVLVNAIYFKGLWVHKFDPSETKPKPFWISATESVNTPMMTVEKDFRVTHNNELDAQLLALDYQGGRMSFVILLPNKRDGLASLEEKLSSVDLETLDRKTATSKIRVTIPKFKLEETIQLVDYLKAMGMTDLFSGSEADLSGISGNKGLFVSHVIHKAFLEVNEEGSEAAAATGMTIMLLSYIEPRSFLVDRPFLFYIKDKRSKQIMFAGRLMKPNLE